MGSNTLHSRALKAYFSLSTLRSGAAPHPRRPKRISETLGPLRELMNEYFRASMEAAKHPIHSKCRISGSVNRGLVAIEARMRQTDGNVEKTNRLGFRLTKIFTFGRGQKCLRKYFVSHLLYLSVQLHPLLDFRVANSTWAEQKWIICSRKEFKCLFRLSAPFFSKCFGFDGRSCESQDSKKKPHNSATS